MERVGTMTRCYCFLFLVAICLGCNHSDSPPGTEKIGLAKSELDLPEEDLENSQVKLAYLGPHMVPIINVVFYTDKKKLSIDRFVDFQFQDDEIRGGNDAFGFSVTPTEMRRMLLAVEPLLTQKKLRTWYDTNLALVLVYESNGSFKGGEYYVENHNAEKFYNVLKGGLEPTNKNGRKILTHHSEMVIPLATIEPKELTKPRGKRKDVPKPD